MLSKLLSLYPKDNWPFEGPPEELLTLEKKISSSLNVKDVWVESFKVTSLEEKGSKAIPNDILCFQGITNFADEREKFVLLLDWKTAFWTSTDVLRYEKSKLCQVDGFDKETSLLKEGNNSFDTPKDDALLLSITDPYP